MIAPLFLLLYVQIMHGLTSCLDYNSSFLPSFLPTARQVTRTHPTYSCCLTLAHLSLSLSTSVVSSNNKSVDVMEGDVFPSSSLLRPIYLPTIYVLQRTAQCTVL